MPFCGWKISINSLDCLRVFVVENSGFGIKRPRHVPAGRQPFRQEQFHQHGQDDERQAGQNKSHEPTFHAGEFQEGEEHRLHHTDA